MTESGRVEMTVTRRRSDYFWALLVDGLNNRIFWLAVLIPPVAEGVLHFKRTEGEEAANRAIEIFAHAAIAAGAVAAAVIAIFYVAAGFNARAPGHQAAITYVATPAGVSVRNGPTAPWSAYTGAVETGALFVLRQKMSALQIVPKRDLSVEAIANLRLLLRQHLGRRAQIQEITP